MFNGLQWWHIVLIAAAFFLIFGAKKLPDAARGLGRSMRILKSEVSAMHDDDLAREGTPAAGANGAATAPGTPAVVTPAIAPAASNGSVSVPVVATAPVADPVSAPAPAGPVLTNPVGAGTPTTVQATTIDGKPAVIINGVPTLIDQAG
jgi:sec-independent protein translocase protein TatA